MKYWVIVIALSASLFRLTFIDLTEFKTDQAYMVYKMAEFHSSPEFFLVGSKNSAGAHNFPLIYYVFALLTLPSRDPLVLTFIIALVNVVAIVFFYLMVRKFYGNFVAVTSALLLSFSPWHILYSRQIWTLDLVVPLTIPFYYFMHKAILDKDGKAIWGVALFGLLLFQWHATGIFLFVTSFLVYLILRFRLSLKHLVLGILLGLIPTIPFFIYQATRSPFCLDCSAYLANQQESQRDFSEVFFSQLFQMTNGLAIKEFMGQDWATFTSGFPLVNLFNFINLLFFFLPFLGIFYILKFKRESSFLILYLLIAPLLLFFMRVNPYGYYELVIVPVVFVVYGLAFKFLYERSKALSVAVLSIIILGNIVFELSFTKFLNDKELIYGQYGPIYRYTDSLIKEELLGQENNKNSELLRAKAMFDYHNDLNPEFKQLYED